MIQGTTCPFQGNCQNLMLTEKLPWFIDLLNINLNNLDLEIAKKE